MEATSIKTYITYFDDNQIEEYNLKSDKNTVLFKGNDTSYSGESINNLNIFYCELCTMYYVWKNNLKSDYVCFKQYRRPFNWERKVKLPKEGEVICFEPVNLGTGTIIGQYAVHHGVRRAKSVFSVLIKEYNDPNVDGYFKFGHLLYTNNSMVLRWEDFCKMCEFVFRGLFAIDKFYELNFNYKDYEDNALIYTEDGRYEYQKHWPAYIGERLVSCYIALFLKPKTIKRDMENNGFFAPYNSKSE